MIILSLSCTQLQQEAVIESMTHTDEEIVAQSICESIMVINDFAGWVYAVGRTCASSGIATCVEICDSCYQHVQDAQTVHRTWTTVGAVHVYQNRPVTGDGTDSTATLGLKVYWSPSYHTNAACGPNYCCCRAV